MKKKGMVKFQGSESKGLLNYIKFEGEYVSITRKSSRKINDIDKTGKLKVSFGLLSRDYNNVQIKIVFDKERIKKVFNFMKAEKHTHYKKFIDDLVVLKYIV